MNLFDTCYDIGIGGGGGPANIIPQQDLSNPYWTLTNYTFASGNNIRETVANAGHSFGQTVPLARTIGTGIYTHSVDLVKLGTDQRFFNLGLFASGFGSGGGRYFDVLNGTNSIDSSYGGFTLSAFSMTPISGGWRCSITVNCTGSAFGGLTILDQDTTPEGTFNYPGVVTDGYTVSNISLTQIG